MQSITLVIAMLCVPAPAEPTESVDENGSPVVSASETVRLSEINLEALGGMAFTPMAWVAHPPEAGRIGRPVVHGVAAAGHDKRLGAVSLTWPITNRFEIGFSHQTLHLGSLRRHVRESVRLDLGTHHLSIDTFAGKFVMVPENVLALDVVPAIAAGVYYKSNPELDDIDRRLLGGLAWLGVDDDDGIDFTLTATKSIEDLLPTPLILTAGVRWTESNQAGFFGFTDGYRALFEASLAWFLTDKLLMGVEYRQKPDRLRRFGSLYRSEDDWWGVFAAYQFDDHTSLGVGVANVGRVANSREPALIGFALTHGF